MYRKSAQIYTQKQLEFVPNQPEKCRMVDGEGAVLILTSRQRKTFFRTDNKYVEEFMIDLHDISPGTMTMELPLNEGKACYKAGVNIMNFLDYQPKGTLTVTKEDGKLKGNIRLKLTNEIELEGTEKETEFEMDFKVEGI